MPRIIALAILERLGVRAFGGLPVLAFAVAPDIAPRVTATYSFRLAANFAAHRNWRHDIEGAVIPLGVLAAGKDELMKGEAYPVAFGRGARVQVLTGIDHMGLTADRAALAAIVAESKRLLGE